MCPTPAASARATTASSSGAKSGKSRWQWLSTSIVSACFFFRLDVTREHRRDRRQRGAGGQAAPCPERREVAFRGRNIEQIQQLAGGCWHEGFSQDRDLPDHFRGHVQHRL